MEYKNENGQIEKSYLVIWHYLANYGDCKVWAISPEEAIKKVYNARDDIEYFVVETEKLALHKPFLAGEELIKKAEEKLNKTEKKRETQ